MKRLLIIAVSLLMPVSGLRGQWSQFRGPHGTGIAAESTDVPLELMPDKASWKIPLPAGHSSPAMWKDRIFLTGINATSHELVTMAIIASTGEVLWRQSLPVKQLEKVHRISNAATATPATDGERVYVYFGSYGMLCYDVAGNKVWDVPLPTPETPFGCGTSPIVHGDTVIVSRDEPKDPYLLALDSRTGKQRWKQPLPKSPQQTMSYSTPVVWGDQLVLHRFGEVSGYAASNGNRLWWLRIATNGTSTPTLDETSKVLYVGAWSNFGEPEVRVPLPGFQDLLDKHDADKDKRLTTADSQPTWRFPNVRSLGRTFPVHKCS